MFTPTWITLSVHSGFIKIISTPNGLIDFKYGIWLCIHVDGAYIVSNFNCCLISMSCFVGLFKIFPYMERVGKYLVWQHVQLHFYHLESNQGNQHSSRNQKNKDQTWKTDIHNKEHKLTKNNTYKVTKVNEQLRLH